MMVCARAVHMPMDDFFLLCAAHAENGHIEVQALTRQRMIGIDDNIGAVNAGERNRLRMTVLGLGLKTHARPQVRIRGKSIPWHALDPGQIPFAISIRGLYDHAQGFAGLPAVQGLLQARNNIAGAVQVAKTAVMGFVNNLAIVPGQGVIQNCHAMFADLHNSLSRVGVAGVSLCVHPAPNSIRGRKWMSDRGLIPEGENLRRAVRWLSETRPATPDRINEAAIRFDLTPLQEEFLLREFLEEPGTST